MTGVLTEGNLSRVPIIDLSLDMRLRDLWTYEKWYEIQYTSPEFIEEVMFGLCGVKCVRDKGARQVANPGR